MKTTEIPNHAKKIFIQLYCEKKGGKTYENLQSAAQSWLSLSLTKKKHFYDTISTKSAVKKAQVIIQTEPYLRAKFPRVGEHNQKSLERKDNQNNGESGSDHTTTDNLVTSVHDDTVMEYDSNLHATDHNLGEILPETENITLGERIEECELEQSRNEPEISDVQKQQKSYMSVIDEDTDRADDFENERNPENDPLVEPVLPITKTGKDLFDLLKARHGINRTYESLTEKEKKIYGRAVTAIKKEYVNKYKKYLESLPPRKLFDYYKKIF